VDGQPVEVGGGAGGDMAIRQPFFASFEENLTFF
jgi:hypothetical protein